MPMCPIPASSMGMSGAMTALPAKTPSISTAWAGLEGKVVVLVVPLLVVFLAARKQKLDQRQRQRQRLAGWIRKG